MHRTQTHGRPTIELIVELLGPAGTYSGIQDSVSYTWRACPAPSHDVTALHAVSSDVSSGVKLRMTELSLKICCAILCGQKAGWSGRNSPKNLTHLHVGPALPFLSLAQP